MTYRMARLVKNVCRTAPPFKYLHFQECSNRTLALARHNVIRRYCSFSEMLLRPAACSSCQVQQCKTIHTSHSNCYQSQLHKANKTKKKLIRAVKIVNKKAKNVVEIHRGMTVSQVAKALDKDTDHVFEVMIYIDHTDQYDSEDSIIDDLKVLTRIVIKSGYKAKVVDKNQTQQKENRDIVRQPAASPELLLPRPPVVTIMGHVDHGKTTLLDALRHTKVVDQEFGGITQHIGAFSVKLPTGESITFLDTPGHAAFTSMRARGTHVTDIVVLVVAADDGIMKQTAESAQLAKQAGVPIIVAINKIDKPHADVEQTKSSLLQLGLVPEDMGGDIQTVPISALHGTNLDKLQSAIVALSEVLEVKADVDGPVEGAVIEARTDPGRGKLTTVLVQRGTLTKGTLLVAGTAWCKVRSMFDDRGRAVTTSRPGDAVQIVGWRDQLPHAGDELDGVSSEVQAKQVVAWRQDQAHQIRLTQDAEAIGKKQEEHDQHYKTLRAKAHAKGIRFSTIYRKERIKEERVEYDGPEMAVLVKGDVDGTVEAILDILDTYDNDNCRLNILNFGVGDISVQDVELAAPFNGIVYGFNVRVLAAAGKAAAAQDVQIRQHNVIYKMIDDIKLELSERLPKQQVEEVIGHANVLQVFSITEGNRNTVVVGCRCNKGSLLKKKRFRVMRDNEQIYNGLLRSMKHFKSEVDSVKMDVECGLILSDQSVGPLVGDTIVCFEYKDKQMDIDWDLQF